MLRHVPGYTVTIHRDGTVDGVGMDHVQVVGKAHGHVDRGGLQQLEVAIGASRFFERDKRGRLEPPACHSDPDLATLERVIDAIANTAQWIGPML